MDAKGRELVEAVFRREAAKAPGLRRGVLESEDPEAVHDLRVLIRRVRTGIRVFEAVLPKKLILLDEPLHGLFAILGLVRDLDVAMGTLGGSAAEGEIRDRLAERRRSAKELLVGELSSKPVLEDFSKQCRRLVVGGGSIDGLKLIEDARRKVRRSLRGLGEAPEIADIHRLRRRLKRLRYVVEFYEPEFGDAAKEYVKRLKELQDVIGEEMDRVTLASLLSSLQGLSAGASRVREALVSRLEREIAAHRCDARAMRKCVRRFGGRD